MSLPEWYGLSHGLPPSLRPAQGDVMAQCQNRVLWILVPGGREVKPSAGCGGLGGGGGDGLPGTFVAWGWGLGTGGMWLRGHWKV